MPFINTSEKVRVTEQRTANVQVFYKPSKSCRLVGLSTPIYTNHPYNYKTPDLLWRVFSLSRIFTDLIMHNYRSIQSALMTRCGTDFRHQLVWNFRLCLGVRTCETVNTIALTLTVATKQKKFTGSYTERNPNFRRWIADVLYAKRHSGRERRRTAVFAG